MKKPSVYLDTSVISAYWYEGADVAMLARRLHTREWWDAERKLFSLWASNFVEDELRAGKYRRQTECVKMIRRMAYLPATSAMKDFREQLLERSIIPESKELDAAHLAIATSHGIDYLLTWNYAHLANATVQAKLDALCEETGLSAPWMVSPESIPQERFGFSVRRKR
jgi:hypothetical protein